MKLFNKQRKQFIVVHSTTTRQNMLVAAMEKLPYHYLVTTGGRVISIKPIKSDEATVDVAWLGGLDRHGRHVDNRTPAQSEALFNTILELSERFPNAQISGADQLSLYGFPNPGFNVKEWLMDYVPEFLLAA